MSEGNTVNSQILDAVTGTVTLSTGQSPSQAFGMIDAVMIETLGMAMYNAVNRQQSSSMIGSAAVTSACARILTMQPPPPPPPPAPPPPSVEPLPGPATPPPSSAAVIAAAMAEGQTAIQVLQAQSVGSSQDAGIAQKDLQALAAAATAAAAPPSSSSSSSSSPS